MTALVLQRTQTQVLIGILFIIVTFLYEIQYVKSIPVKPKCSPDEEVCSFYLHVTYNISMTLWEGQVNDPDVLVPVRVDLDGNMKSLRKNCSGSDSLSQYHQDSIVSGDGTYKRILLVNGQLPGTPIIVYENQYVAVTVKNGMTNEVLTMHWHGLVQRNTPWMDGVGTVSQCPIQPRQSFVYRFVASPVGSHWYHSHFGTQRNMGLFGPLIVLLKPKTKKKQSLAAITNFDEIDRLEEFDADYVMMVNDWMNDTTSRLYHRLNHELLSMPYETSGQCYRPTRQIDGLEVGITPFFSALINGKGRRYDPVTQQVVHKVPLEVFRVERGQRVRFRLIATGMMYPFRVSVDRHELHVIATDGNNVQTRTVESIIINSGERYDFWIDALDPGHEGNYWIRAETLEHYSISGVMAPNKVNAILRYNYAREVEPTSKRRRCNKIYPCDILNCPFRQFPPSMSKHCIPLTELRGRTGRPALSDTPDKLTELFYNFHFSGKQTIGAFKPNINGRVHIPHNAPPQIYPEFQRTVPCSEAECLHDACMCTHQVELPLGNLIQITLSTFLPNLDINGTTGTTHPVHIHGHHFEVIKIGWPQYDSSGLFMSNNADLACGGAADQFCSGAHWANQSWSGGNVPGLIHSSPPKKDTISIPAGGYVVIRLRADNPGFWIMHCHMEIHNEMGMALVFQEGEIRDMNQAPPLMQQCGDFTWTSKEFNQKIHNPKPSQEGRVKESGVIEELLGWRVAVVALACASLGLGCHIVAVQLHEKSACRHPPSSTLSRSRSRSPYTRLHEDLSVVDITNAHPTERTPLATEHCVL